MSPQTALVEFAVIDSPAAFLALEAEWNSLFARCGRPHQVFQSHVVLRHWTSHYLSAGGQLAILCARIDGRLAMVWPLVLRRRLGISVLRFMGGPVAQFSDVLAEDQPGLLAAGWQALVAIGADVLEIRKLREDARLAELALPVDSIITEREEALFADCAMRVAADGPGPAYSARDRSNFRRRLRRLSERGTIALSLHGPSQAAVALAREAVLLKRAALSRQGIFAPAITDVRFEEFFADLAGDCYRGSPLRLATIHLEGTPRASISLSTAKA